MPRRFHTAYIPRHPSDPGESLGTLTVSDLQICLEANYCEPRLYPCKAPYGGSIPPAASMCLGRWMPMSAYSTNPGASFHATVMPQLLTDEGGPGRTSLYCGRR